MNAKSSEIFDQMAENEKDDFPWPIEGHPFFDEVKSAADEIKAGADFSRFAAQRSKALKMHDDAIEQYVTVLHLKRMDPVFEGALTTIVEAGRIKDILCFEKTAKNARLTREENKIAWARKGMA